MAGGPTSPLLRARISEKLAWLGAVLDPGANAAGKSLISRPESRVALLVVPTDEELMIAQHTLALLPQPGTRRVVGESLATDARVSLHPKQRRCRISGGQAGLSNLTRLSPV
jgi:hypothetical protein